MCFQKLIYCPWINNFIHLKIDNKMLVEMWIPLCMHLSVLINTYCTSCLRLCCACNKFSKKLALLVARSILRTNCSIILRNPTGSSLTPMRSGGCFVLSYIATKVPIIYNGMPNPIVTCCLYTSTTGSLATFSHYTCSGKHFPIQVSIHNYKVHCYKAQCWFCYWPALFCLT